MMNKNTDMLVGKMIKSIEKDTINMWIIHFTDGSFIELWAENDGPLGIPQLYVEEYKAAFNEM